MAQCVQSVQEFLQDSFVPMVAVLCSKEADRVSRKNKLSFPELLRPFCRLLSEGMGPNQASFGRVRMQTQQCLESVLQPEPNQTFVTATRVAQDLRGLTKTVLALKSYLIQSGSLLLNSNSFWFVLSPVLIQFCVDMFTVKTKVLLFLGCP